jgi:mannitol-1-/sugar-/sorbitol-6-phosphatase
MMQLPARALLFDLDGTLVDSFASAHRAWNSWAEQFGVPTPVLGPRTHGTPRPGVVKMVLPGVSDEDAAMHAESIRQAELNDVDGVVALPGALDLLKSLPSGSWAIVTSCDRATAEARLHAAQLPVPDVLVPADEIPHGKPHPEGFLKAAGCLEVAPHDAIVLEDAPAGFQAAEKAGMRAVATRHTTPDEQLTYASAIVDDPSQLSALVQGNALRALCIRTP